jgi:tetratricopeptide (TPR) repeat protein
MRRREQLLALAVLLAASVPLIAVSTRVQRALGADRPYDVAYVPRGEAVRLFSPSVQLSMANFYWLQTVQYIGEPRGRERGFEQLYPLVDLVTDLDPRHGYAYQTAGIVLSSVGRLDESDRILKKGMGPERPNWWSYPFYVAFNNYFYRGDYVEAARWAKIAARTPGASANISHLALALDVKSGSPDDAVRFLEEMRSVAKDDKTAAALDEQYRLAVLQRDFARLDAAVGAYRQQTGHPPRDLGLLVSAGLLPELPAADPFGGTYYLDREGTVHATGRDFRFRPPAAAPLRAPGRP